MPGRGVMCTKSQSLSKSAQTSKSHAQEKSAISSFALDHMLADKMAQKRSTIDLVKNISRTRFVRSGIVPYYFQKGKLYLFLGLDKRFQELTDFSGRTLDKEEDYLTTAVREFNEEARMSFEQPTYSQLRDCVCVHDKTDIVIFVPTKRRLREVVMVFRTKLNLTGAQKHKRDYNEMSDVYLLNEKYIQNELLDNKSEIMYDRFHKLVRGAVSTVEELKQALIKERV